MQSRWLLQFLSALSSLILLKAQDVIGSGPSCVRSRPANGGQTRVNFLREDAAGVRSLYLTLWSEDMRPVSCEVTSNPQVTEKYRAHCDRGGTQGQDITQRFNISVLLAPDAPCAFASSSAPKFTGRVRRDGTRSRRKRSWIFPGTLWCGTGSRAIRYDQLGMFERADRCCREHDHCQHFIPALTKNYGVFNPNVYTVSHCDCDKRFRRCLLGVNDSISNMVAYSFFNILKVPCFEFNQQRRCTQIHWCKEATEALHAVFKKPLPFNRTDVTSNYLDDVDSNNVTSSERQHVTESPVITPHTTKPKHRFGCRDPHSGDTFYHRRRKGKGCKRHRKLSTASASMSRAHNTTPSVETSLLHSSKSTTLIPTKKRGGKKKSTRKSLSSQPTQRSQDGSQVTTNSYPQTTSTTHRPSSPPAITETTNKTATTHRPSSPPAVNETTKKTATTHRPSSPSAVTETTNKTATTHRTSSPPAVTETTNKTATTHRPSSPPAVNETTNKTATTHRPSSPPAVTEAINKTATTHQPSSPPAVTETTNERATTHQPSSPPAITETTNKTATTHRPSSPPAVTETTNKTATTHRPSSPPAVTETTNKTATTHRPSSPPAVNETTNKTATTHRPSSPPAVTETTNKTATTHRPSSPPAVTEAINKTATTHQPSSPPAVTETTNERATTHQPSSPPAITETTNKTATTHQPSSPPAVTEATNKTATTHRPSSPPAVTEITNKTATTHRPSSPSAVTETTNKTATTHRPSSPPAVTETTNERTTTHQPSSPPAVTEATNKTATAHRPSSPPAITETTNKTATTHQPSSPPAVTEATNKTATAHRPSSPPAITETTNKTATTHQPSSPPAITETTNKRTTTQSHCCGSSTPLRGDRFHPHCKSCLEQKTTPHINTAEPSTTTHHQPIKVTNPEILWLKTTTETPEQNMSSTTDSAILTSATLKAAASVQNGGTTQKQMDSHLLWNNTSQEVMGRTKAPNTERGLKRHSVLHNMTDSQLLCLRLNRLDECKYKILPLEKKYNLQNMESKTAYHCDCTNRLAVQIKSFKKPSILPTLLMDFVSQYCFNLPKEEDCRSRKSCSGGFTKASDLLQALKKIEEKDIGRVRKSGRKRRNPVRLSKRCLRLEREDDIMAQLT